MRSGWLLPTALVVPSQALLNPFDRVVLSTIKRPQFEQLVRDRFGANVPVQYIDDLSTPQTTSMEIWRWVNRCAEAEGEAVLCLSPSCTAKEAERYAEMIPPGCVVDSRGATKAISPLGQDSPLQALVATPTGDPQPEFVAPVAIEVDSKARHRMQAWVGRTLVGLGMCPFTQSVTESGHQLADLDVLPAPILYTESGATTLPGVLAAFWASVIEMLEKGESGTSSIILAAPAWDDKWHSWHQDVFPALEASVLASGLGRKLGVVCFHPAYDTPSPAFLRRNRFGHMHGPSKLRGWVDGARDRGALLQGLGSESAGKAEGEGTAVVDEALQWAGSYQRRSPHAMINVLWSRQLEVAETRRASDNLYVRNVRRLLKEGPASLEVAAANERKGLPALDLAYANQRIPPGIASEGTADVGPVAEAPKKRRRRRKALPLSPGAHTSDQDIVTE